MQSHAQLDPKDFIITRKRKQYRFALFHNAENCFELSDWKPLTAKNLVVEVGAGTALLLVELAKRYPSKNFIALDVKADRLQKGAGVALELGLNNISFVRARADQLLEVVKLGSVKDIWLTFSDPFPKKSDAKRRLTYPMYLEIYRKAHVLKNAHLYMKTDDHNLFDWTLEQLVATKWQIDALSYDLHESNLGDDFKLTTTYEKKWRGEGKQIMFLAGHTDPR